MESWIAVLQAKQASVEEDRALLRAILVYTANNEKEAREMAEGTISDLHAVSHVEIESVRPLIAEGHEEYASYQNWVVSAVPADGSRTPVSYTVEASSTAEAFTKAADQACGDALLLDDDTDENKARSARIKYLEPRILYGESSEDEVWEYRRLVKAHEAWIRTTPEFAAMTEGLRARGVYISDDKRDV